MKRVIFILLVGLMCPAVAQQAVLSKGMETKHVKAENLIEGRYLGAYEGLDCWVFVGKKDRKQVVKTDQNLEPVGEVVLPESGDGEVLAAVLAGNHAVVVTLDQSERQQTVVLSYDVDLDSMVVADGAADTLLAFEHGKKDKCMVWGAASPNGNYIGLVGIVQLPEQQYRTMITLYDSQLQRLWEKEFALGSMQDIFVTDDGRIVTLGKEDEAEGMQFVYNVLSREKAATYTAGFKGNPIRDLKLVNVLGSHAVSIATFMPGTKKSDAQNIGGVIGMSFNIDSAKVTGFELRPFQNEDINILFNKDTRKVQRELEADHLKQLDMIPTSWGAAAAYGRCWRRDVVANNGEVSMTYFSMGIHCISVDTLGRVSWVRNVRRNDSQKSDNDQLQISLIEHQGKVLLFKTESPKIPAGYDISKKVKTFDVNSKSNLVFYSLDGEEAQKLVVESKTKHTMLRTLKRADGSLMLLTAKGKKMRLAKLSFME